MAFIKSQFSGEGLVQQRLLQRLLRGELLHVEGFQALWQIGAGGLYHLGSTFMVGSCVGVRPRGRRDFGFSSGFHYNPQARARKKDAENVPRLPADLLLHGNH